MIRTGRFSLIKTNCHRRKFVFDQNTRRGHAVDSVVASGCIVSGSTVRKSVLFSGVRVNSYCKIEHSVLLPEVVVGRHCRLKKVVVDRGCHLPEGLVVGEDAVADAKRFYRTEKGVVLINDDMIKAL